MHPEGSSQVPLGSHSHYLGESKSNHSDGPKAHRERENSEYTDAGWDHANGNYRVDGAAHTEQPRD